MSHALETTGQMLDVLGVAVMVIGITIATGSFMLQMRVAAPFHERFVAYRLGLGRAILLGLEILVAADIIRTVAVRPTFESVGVLALIVLIRTFLSIALEVEIQGRFPWTAAPEPARSETREL